MATKFTTRVDLLSLDLETLCPVPFKATFNGTEIYIGRMGTGLVKMALMQRRHAECLLQVAEEMIAPAVSHYVNACVLFLKRYVSA